MVTWLTTEPERDRHRGAWEISEQLAPLQSFKEKMTLVTGLNVPFSGVREPHFETACRFMVGEPLFMNGDDWAMSGKTFDQRMADALGQSTRLSLEFGTDTKRNGLSHTVSTSTRPQRPRRLLRACLWRELSSRVETGA